jgi:hypothetical protein
VVKVRDRPEYQCKNRHFLANEQEKKQKSEEKVPKVKKID